MALFHETNGRNGLEFLWMSLSSKTKEIAPSSGSYLFSLRPLSDCSKYNKTHDMKGKSEGLI